MLSKLLTSVFLLGLIGCESKEYKKDSNSNVEVVSELNQGDYKSVIRKLESKSEKTPREKYYLASAIAQKAGVDVFSLYGVLELQLFQKKALDWSELSKDKNPYARFMKDETKEEIKIRKAKRKEKWSKYLPKIIERNGIRVTQYTLSELQEENPILTQDDYDAAINFLEKKVQRIREEFISKEDKLKRWFEFMETDEMLNFPRGSYSLAEYYEGQLKLESLEENYLTPSAGGFESSGVQIGLMNFLWNTYETIPMLKKMPNLTMDQQVLVTESMELFKELSSDKEFGQVSLKNTLILGGVSFLSIYKESFDLDDINAPLDLLCTFDVTKLMDNYTTIRERLLFVADLIPQLDKNNKLKASKSQIEELKHQMPEEISSQHQEKIIDQIEKYKLDQCFNS